MRNEGSIYTSFIVTAVINETPNAKSFEIKPANGQKVIYEAGQFITLVFRKADKEDRRSYSFSSAPALHEPLRITVKRIANGEYSRQLLNHIKAGDTLTSSGISGFFRLPARFINTRQIVFLAAGSGITPIYSLLKTVLHITELPVVLIYSNYSKKETIFYKELVELKRRFKKRLRTEFLFNHPDSQKRRLSKFLLNELLEKHKIPLQDTLFYLCGPSNYMLTAGISLVTAGVPQQNIRKENFNTRQHAIKPLPPDTNGHNVKISVHRSWYEFTVQYPDTILAAAKKLNIHLPYSCEAGNCGSCTATCIEGKTWMAYNEVLTDEEIKQGKVLTCQGYPVEGDVVLKF